MEERRREDGEEGCAEMESGYWRWREERKANPIPAISPGFIKQCIFNLKYTCHKTATF